MNDRLITTLKSLARQLYDSLRWTLCLYGIVAAIQIGMLVSELFYELNNPEIYRQPSVAGPLYLYSLFWLIASPFIAGGIALVLYNKFRVPGWRSPILNIVGRLILLSVLYGLATITFPVWD